MALTEAKCTNCGANIKVDPAQDAANCEYCGAAFIVEKAINNYNIANAQITAQTVNVNVGSSESPTIMSMLKYADSIRDSEPVKALEEYENVLRIAPDNYEARFFKLACGEAQKNIEKTEYYAKHIMTTTPQVLNNISGKNKDFGLIIISKSYYGEPPKPSMDEKVKLAFDKIVVDAKGKMPDDDYKRIFAYYQKNVVEAFSEAKKWQNDLTEKQKHIDETSQEVNEASFITKFFRIIIGIGFIIACVLFVIWWYSR
jgi:DNA-directed RNA polymerase subunit RPC12/RpoP